MALLRLNANRNLTLNGQELKRQNVLLLVDTSGSMADEGEDENADTKIEQAKAGAIDFARSVKHGVSTALAIFGTRAAMVSDPLVDAERFARKIGGLRTNLVGGSTNLAAGLLLANQFANQFPLNTVVVVTDGQPDDENAALVAATNLKRRNIEIICIGTDDADEEFLKKLAGKAGKAIHVRAGNLRKAIGQAQLLLK
jgi:Mg-chelatase subunit ChlD